MGPPGHDRDALAGVVGEAVGADDALELDEGRVSASAASLGLRGPRKYLAELLVVALAYFVLAKVGLTLASIHPSATPIWPPTGLALAAIMLRGYRVCPAILLAAWLANATTAGSVYTSLAIALGNTLESLVGAYLIGRWSGGLGTFDTPVGVARFALISLAVATPISATVGVGSLTLAGYAETSGFASTWMTWWLGDLAGALVIAPVVVLWTTSYPRTLSRQELLETAAVILAAIAVGVLAFSPLIGPLVNRDPLGFLVILPLIWAALRLGQRDTATVALVLSCLAVWGTMSGQGPFARPILNDSFLLLLMFMISASLPALALSADVSVRKRTERSLRETHEKLDQIVQERSAALEETRQTLHQAQKMEALGQLTGGIAHDFNNVLTVIMNSLESVRASPGHDDKTRARLERASQAAGNGASLIQQMLVFARKHPLRLQSLDLNEIIDSALKMFRRGCPENIEVLIELEPDLPRVQADSTQLQTAILNLALNARDAMPAGGRLTVRTTSSPPWPRPSAALAAVDCIGIEVSDNGVGMTPEIAARAVDPFFTTKEIGKGTGLGLSMVYSAIRQMRGDVAIESKSGEGTSVRLILPASAATDDAPETQSAAARSKAKPRIVLYVEDNLLVSLATVDLLEGAGYSIHAAPDGKRALALLREHPEIELLITDVGLPGMNGHELAAEVRRLRPDLKVLFLSGYDRTQWTREPAEGAGTSYLGKPYQESDLLDILQRLSDGAGTSTG